MSTSPPASPLPLLRDFGDHFSPLVVKELRQGLRTRFFTMALLLFHTGVIVLLSSVLMEAPTEVVNGIFWGAAGLMLLVVLPLRGFNALNGEAADGTLDMLTLTSISSTRILQGKWVALFSQTLLVAGSLLPYMVARYYFGGVEIVREAVALAALVLASGMVEAALLAFSSQRSVLLRLALAVGIGFGAVPLGFFVAFLVSSSDADQMMRQFFALDLWAQTSLAVAALLLPVYVIWYFLALGASRIAPPSENHSTRKRAIVLAVHAVITMAGLLLAGLGTRGDQGMWAFMPLFALTLLACMDTMTEEMPRFPVAMAGVGTSGLPRAWGLRLLQPGWASGVGFSALLCVLALGVLGVICARTSGWAKADGPLPIFACLFAGAFVPIVIRVRKASSFVNWWVVQICLVAAGILLAMACSASGARDSAVIGIVTPVTTLFGSACVSSSQVREGVLIFGCFAALAWVAGAMVRAGMNFSIYSKLESEARQLAASAPSPPAAPADA